MILTVPQLLQRTKDHVGEDRTRGNISDSVVLDYINSGIRLLAGEIQALRHDFFASYYDLSLDGSREYNLPLDIERVFAVEDITSGSDNPYDTSPIFYEDRFRVLSMLSDMFSYYIRHHVFGVPSECSSGTMRIWYPKPPRPLYYGTCSASTSTTCTLATATLGTRVPENDFYNGMLLITDDLQYRLITDYTSAGVFTVDTSWSSNPTAASTVVSLAVPLGLQAQDLIHIQAGIDFRLDLDMDETPLLRRKKEYMNALELLLTRPNTQRSKRVKHVNR